MLPSSQQVLMIPPQRSSGESALLTEAFAEFIAASSRLEVSYRDLQVEVAELSQTLSERNRALTASLSENKVLGDRLQRILETIPCGVLVVGDDGAVQLANPEASRLLAMCAGEPSSITMNPLLEPALRLELQASLPLKEENEQEIAFETLAGRVWVAVRRVQLPAMMPTTAGTPEAVWTLRDISARKRMEEEREAARDAVALAQVSALLAHEIRNPLASLELFAGLLGDEPNRREEWLSHLRAGIRSLSGTVNNVLTLQGNTPLLLEVVDVPTEAGLAVDFLQPMALQAQVSLRFVNELCSAASQARGNRSALHQILMNLCANALRHTPAGGIVEVRCRVKPTPLPASIQIDVTDTGCGIPDEHFEQIFDVGFSGSGVTCGLGLAVCDRLARQMGGSLAVQSRYGHGSTFSLEIAHA